MKRSEPTSPMFTWTGTAWTTRWEDSLGAPPVPPHPYWYQPDLPGIPEDSDDRPRTSHLPRRFHLERTEDVSGVSGTGTVAYGVKFYDGACVIRWEGETPSTVVWGSVNQAMRVHGHEGRTQCVWDD